MERVQQPDLFGFPPTLPSGPEGLACRGDAIDRAQEAALIAAIDALPLSPFRFQGWLGKRLTVSFGWSYDFDTGEAAAAPPIPDWLLPVRKETAKFAELPEEDFVQALLIRYDPGAGIGWHRDRPIFEHIVGLSLGARATLRLRRRAGAGFDRHNTPLVPRSLYRLSGDARHLWEHGIAPMDSTRWSITFRTLSEKGRRLLG